MIAATHTGSKAHEVSTEDGGNLSVSLNVSIGARVMLTENIWTERGLVNGAQGTLRDIVWPNGTTDPRSEPPTALLIEFDKYDGPALVELSGGHKLVPNLRSKREWTRGDGVCSRVQFPIIVAYAITVHKSQGITVDRAVLDLSDKADFVPGLTYVAISRVRSLEGVLFEGSFDVKRLRGRVTDTAKMRADDQAIRSKQQLTGSCIVSAGYFILLTLMIYRNLSRLRPQCLLLRLSNQPPRVCSHPSSDLSVPLHHLC